MVYNIDNTNDKIKNICIYIIAVQKLKLLYLNYKKLKICKIITVSIVFSTI